MVLGWFASETKCCVDYFVLEVDMVKSSEYAIRRKKDRKFKRLYEGPAREYALYSVPYSVNIITRVFGVNPTGEGTPSEELVLSTPKGSFCIVHSPITTVSTRRTVGLLAFQAKTYLTFSAYLFFTCSKEV